MMTSVRDIVGPAGRLEVRVDEPASLPARAVAVVAPPNPELGGTLNDRVVFYAVQGLRRIGCRVWRFNFRGVGTSEGAFDHARGELDDFRAVLDAASGGGDRLPLYAVGYSFGAYAAVAVGSVHPGVAAIVAIAPPLSGYDFSPLAGTERLKVIIHGERDELTPLKAVHAFYGTLAEPRELIVIDGADHVFDGHVSEVGEAIADVLE